MSQVIQLANGGAKLQNLIDEAELTLVTTLN